MAKTLALKARPTAKGKYQRKGQRANRRRYPPNGQEWGVAAWPPSQTAPATYALLMWESGIVAPPTSTAMRANNLNPNAVTHLFISETYMAGGTGDPIATWVVNDPIRIYKADDTTQWIEYKITAASDAGTYRDYTVTYTTTAGGGWAPFPGMGVGIIERTGSPTGMEGMSAPSPYSVVGQTIAQVQEYVNGLGDSSTPENQIEIERLLDEELANANRSTLTSWLEARLIP